jgi:nucleoside-diphosphate-sugar epimerase
METKPKALLMGCGYLNTRVGALLLERGYRVMATTRTPSRLDELAALGFEPVILDLARPDESSVWDLRPAAVVYAVAPGRRGDAQVAFGDGPQECARRILAGGRPLPRRLVFISSTGLFTEDHGGWVDEESPAEPPEERLQCLRATEDALSDQARREGLPAVILRLGGIYGPGRTPTEWLRREAMREKMARGRGDAFMNWVRVEDAAAATVLAIDKGRLGEVYVITDGNPVRRAEFYGEAARLAGLKLPPFAGEGGLGKRCRIDKARRELDFEPRYPSYREGLQEL